MKDSLTRKKYGKKASGTIRGNTFCIRLTDQERTILDEVARKRGVALSHIFQDFICVLPSLEHTHIPANFLKMALAICDVSASEKVCKLILSIVSELQIKGGDFSVHDAVRLKLENDKNHEQAEGNA